MFCYFLAWIPDSKHFQPVLGRKFHVEYEFDVKNSLFLRPEGKDKEKRNQKKTYVLVTLKNEYSSL